MRATLLVLAVLSIVSAPAQKPAPSQTANCNVPTPEPIVHVTVASNPFQALPTADGCWAFVSLSGTPETRPQIALLKRAGGAVSVTRELPVPHGNPTGMALTHDGKLLAVAAGPGVAFFDVNRFV